MSVGFLCVLCMVVLRGFLYFDVLGVCLRVYARVLLALCLCCVRLVCLFLFVCVVFGFIHVPRQCFMRRLVVLDV